MISIVYFNNPTKSYRSSKYFAHAFEVIKEHDNTATENLYDFIQDPDMSRMVSKKEWLDTTGLKYAPSNIRGSGEKVPLPPQQFDWADILPIWER